MENRMEHKELEGRAPVLRQEIRPPVVRKPSKVDIMINSAILFMQRLGVQLSKTLLATALAALADYIRKKTDKETSDILTRHGGMHNQEQKTENQKSLYGNYPTESRSNYGGYYGSDYNTRKNYGHDSFPGFGN